MTKTETKCPEPVYLEKFVLGQLPIGEIEDCQRHLSQCDPCVETIQSLKIDDTFSGIARQAFESELLETADEKIAVENMILDASKWKFTGRKSDAVSVESESNANRSAEVDRLLGEPIHSEDIGLMAHYRIIELLGTGSTGIVYLAIDTKLERQVVLKILRPSLGPAARERFVAEGRATAKLDHPNIVTIYEVGNDGPLSYLAMQWLPGKTLEDKLQAEESFSVDNTRRLIKEIASGLAAAHNQDLIHRDIKPANIWIPDHSDPAKILDFGLVRIADEDPQLTCTGMIAGTPCFMSPEQSRGASIDRRSDLFSLGCVMYQCLTGQLPFHSENALATLRSIQKEQPTEPRELNPSIDVATSDLAMCLLEKSPSQRPATADAVIAALDNDPESWEFEYQPHAVEAQPKRKRSGFGIWKAIAAMLLGAAVGVFGLAYGQQIIRVATNQGVIEIDSKVDDVKVEIVDGGEVIKVVDLQTEQTIQIKAGNYEIRPLGNDNSVAVENGNLVLSRGETEIVTISRESKANDLAKNSINSGPYLLKQGDVLGIFIDGIFGEIDGPIPVHFPGNGQPPVSGYPVPIGHEGSIAVPFLGDLSVAGLSVDEARKKLVYACTVDSHEGNGPILRKQARILVNLMHRSGQPNFNTARPMITAPSASKTSSVVEFPLSKVNSTSVKSEDSQFRMTTPSLATPPTAPQKSTVQVPFGVPESQSSIQLPAAPNADLRLQTTAKADLDKLLKNGDKEDPLFELKVLKAKANFEFAKKTSVHNGERELKLLALAQQQLKFIDGKLDSDIPQSLRKDLTNQRIGIRGEVVRLRNDLNLSEFLQAPVYEGLDYESWYRIANSERNLNKFNQAIIGMANLASPSEYFELMDTVIAAMNRGPGIADSKRKNEFQKTISQVLGVLDAKTFINYFNRKLRAVYDDEAKELIHTGFKQTLLSKLEARNAKLSTADLSSMFDLIGVYADQNEDDLLWQGFIEDVIAKTKKREAFIRSKDGIVETLKSHPVTLRHSQRFFNRHFKVLTVDDRLDLKTQSKYATHYRFLASLQGIDGISDSVGKDIEAIKFRWDEYQQQHSREAASADGEDDGGGAGLEGETGRGLGRGVGVVIGGGGGGLIGGGGFAGGAGGFGGGGGALGGRFAGVDRELSTICKALRTLLTVVPELEDKQKVQNQLFRWANEELIKLGSDLKQRVALDEGVLEWLVTAVGVNAVDFTDVLMVAKEKGVGLELKYLNDGVECCLVEKETTGK